MIDERQAGVRTGESLSRVLCLFGAMGLFGGTGLQPVSLRFNIRGFAPSASRSVLVVACARIWGRGHGAFLCPLRMKDTAYKAVPPKKPSLTFGAGREHSLRSSATLGTPSGVIKAQVVRARRAEATAESAPAAEALERAHAEPDHDGVERCVGSERGPDWAQGEPSKRVPGDQPGRRGARR